MQLDQYFSYWDLLYQLAVLLFLTCVFVQGVLGFENANM